MAGGKQTMEVPVAMKHPAEVVWKAYIQELETTLPGSMPGHFSKIEHVEGPPAAPGSVFIVTYGKDVSHYEHLKLRWDAIDHDKFTFRVKLVGGGALGKHFNYLVYNLKIVPNAHDANGCVMHFTVEYEDIGDHTFHDFIKEEIQKMCTGIEAHISSNT